MRPNTAVGYVCMALLALQFGMQPIITQMFMSPSTDMTVVVTLGEVLKVFIALAIMVASDGVGIVVRGCVRKCVSAGAPAALTCSCRNNWMPKQHTSDPKFTSLCFGPFRCCFGTNG